MNDSLPRLRFSKSLFALSSHPNLHWQHQDKDDKDES